MTRTLLLAALLAAPSSAQHHHHGDGGAPSAAAAREPALLARSVARYRDVRVAEREGWGPSPLGREDSPLMGEHWVRRGAREPLPGEPLDFTEPTNLQYAWVNGRRELVGTSFVVRIAPGDPLLAGFSGSADRWHVHDVLKGVDAATEGRPLLRLLANGWIEREYLARGDDRSRLAMVHAWVTVPSPDGPFAMHNRAIPFLRVGLPWSFAAAANDAAAMGVNLASPKGCANSLDGMLWIADAGAKQKRALAATCAGLAARMRAAVATRDAAAVVKAGQQAWDELEAAKRATLSADQRRRIAAITDHDPMNEVARAGAHRH